MENKIRIITDFEKDNLHFIIDEDMIIYAKVNNVYYNVHTLIDFIKSINLSDANGFNDAIMANHVRKLSTISSIELSNKY